MMMKEHFFGKNNLKHKYDIKCYRLAMSSILTIIFSVSVEA